MSSEEKGKTPLIKKKGVDNYLKYSGLGFQMIAILILTWWLGSKLDQWMELETPYFTAGLMLLGIILFFVTLIMQLNSDAKKEAEGND